MPREIVIVEGLLPLAERRPRDSIDVAVFLEPDEPLRRRWKLERDAFDRGYPPAEVVAEIHRREHDAETFVRPQRVFADMVVSFLRPPDAPEPSSATLTVRPTLPYPGLRELVGGIGHGPWTPLRWATDGDGRGPLSRARDRRRLPAVAGRRASRTSSGRRCAPTTGCSAIGSASCARPGTGSGGARRWRSRSC